MEKCCRTCKYCQNNPYGEWFCVDKKGKIIKEITDLNQKSCKKYNKNEDLSEYIKMWIK